MIMYMFCEMESVVMRTPIGQTHIYSSMYCTLEVLQVEDTSLVHLNAHVCAGHSVKL